MDGKIKAQQGITIGYLFYGEKCYQKNIIRI